MGPPSKAFHLLSREWGGFGRPFFLAPPFWGPIFFSWRCIRGVRGSVASPAARRSGCVTREETSVMITLKMRTALIAAALAAAAGGAAIAANPMVGGAAM